MNTIVTVNLAERSYPIYIGSNALQQLSQLACLASASSLVLVTNPTVAAIYANTVKQLLRTHGKAVHIVSLPDGEVYKTSAQLDTIYTAMLEHRCDRKAVVVALGGGVIGDVAGYAAATYMRGVPFVQVPTTLLSQVDSSVGGKTAVNHPLGKNMIGAFYQPQAVVADALVLRTLPQREVSAGIAEIVKYGCIVDLAFFDWLEHNMAALRQLDASITSQAVQRSCEIKAQVVAQDETETADIRALLNFGHTFGHAFETILGYGQWLHGEAVGYGMVCAAALSHHLGLIDDAVVKRIESLVGAAGLPTKWPASVSADDTLNVMRSDKKTAHGALKFIVLDALGQSRVQTVQDSVVKAVISKLQGN